MKLLLTIIFCFFILFTFSCDKKEKTHETKNFNLLKENSNLEYAKSELKSAIIKNEILVEKVIPDSQTAVNVAESILFKIYGKENITKQKPYDVNFIDDYYVINGTLSRYKMGGTFLIIINSKDGKVIKLTHGK
ncbi:NTF2 fold immunity protein [Chryseobacterium terrae]|uniref:NTF2 fold immunity protein n=1 Tax=Chryseobacterium terrae TaxID=3163299 RepID=A0ABW8Y364_9FLAO